MPQPEGSSARPGWLTIEVDQSRLTENMRVFRRLVGADSRLMAVVKADAYGHGLFLAARAFLAGGADVLGVHSLDEALALRRGGFSDPVLILGPVLGEEALLAATVGAEITVASRAAAEELARVAPELDRTLPMHLKVETGVNRQGVTEEELDAVLELLEAAPQARLVGLSSHFADIEDTTDHSFAQQQMSRFEGYQDRLVARGHERICRHMTCSAATLLWDQSHWDMARVGISAYGLWPSRETLVSVRQKNRPEVRLQPALTWKVRVSQVRSVPAGQTVGYGRTWKAMADSRIAVLPVGYSDGWPRALSGRAHVLLHGKRAPLVGRICMNLCMVDVTHIPEVTAGDEAVLLGRQGEEEITAEQLAEHLGTISYEVLTWPGKTWRRVAV